MVFKDKLNLNPMQASAKNDSRIPVIESTQINIATNSGKRFHGYA
tara:strand:- start:92 stop:226 length:135 start_codon:yes stop_codon:yes gene_type:complete